MSYNIWLKRWTSKSQMAAYNNTVMTQKRKHIRGKMSKEALKKIWDASKPSVHKSKKTYSRKKKHKKNDD